MANRGLLDRRSEDEHRAREDDHLAGSDRSVVLRNYDGSESHSLHVEFVNADGDIAFSRRFTLAPQETMTLQTRLERAVYRVSVRLDEGETASAECLIGSGVSETALVETGNGTVSVTEGVV